MNEKLREKKENIYKVRYINEKKRKKTEIIMKGNTTSYVRMLSTILLITSRSYYCLNEKNNKIPTANSFKLIHIRGCSHIRNT